jgi:DNA-binding beta-propeller fold protein YncE
LDGRFELPVVIAAMSIRQMLLTVPLAFAAMLAALSCTAAEEPATYSIVRRIAAPGGAWDYASVDQQGGRLYLAQAGITAIDLKTDAVTPDLISAQVSHGVAILGGGAVAVDDSRSKVVTVFEGATGKITATIATAADNPVSGMHALDALVLEPRTGLLVAINGESGLLLLIDLKKSSVVGTISVGGHPEFAVADGTGTLWINVNRGETAEVAAVDIASRAVVKHVRLNGCKGATGLAYDEKEKLIMSVCDSGVLKVLDERGSRVVASIPVGEGADAVMFDSKRRRAFVASADAGTLSVIAVRSAHDIAVVQTLSTQPGTRLGAVDVESGRVYLPAARFGPPKPPSPYPSVVPGSFQFIVVAPD